ncbi:MAG: UDP-N-acetylmuramoyl-L-alanyl-D-glutamate--2,6-diaminopimelate ligase [Balneolaceae bacterium]|nr:UDP-N-acetylmuramoyl-L-alanyl-D-glutamate--2,6-diaminopimelate ligase [Balneolaceae bacterium]MCH8547727.1 UDP-N-acetylmuramoyl-L-alanyl-D-glutamate--2,6-diaminopimelate ligase [Balneolaceae bacterium]
MKSSELITFCDPISVQGVLPGDVKFLRLDSRAVKPGDVFIAVSGTKTDGHNYISSAIENGAAAVIVEKDIEHNSNVALLKVADTRSLLAPLAQRFAGDPAKKLRIIGITGTNGKTTVATLVYQTLRGLQRKCALLGTVTKIINDRKIESLLTTSDPIELANDMQQMVEAGCEFLVMEVSSHALVQKRVHSIPFEVAAFTNLSHDHLDYHESMEGYASAKQILFNELDRTSWAVVNADAPYSDFMVKNTEAKRLDFSFEGKGLFQAIIWTMSPQGSLIEVEGIEFNTPLTGRFNAVNVVQALLICTALGFDGKKAGEQIEKAPGAEGRMEKVNPDRGGKDQPVIIVDYAHTPDALKNVASTLAEVKEKNQKLTILFGCGGDRDRKKRPEMAAIAEEFGDLIYVTSDNPRTEDPESIIREIEEGFSKSAAYHSITDRKEAIRKSILESDIKTIILIAGKGHETYQEINGERIHFDDREVAREVLDEFNRNFKTRGN